jgi:hypothetical protein
VIPDLAGTGGERGARGIRRHRKALGHAGGKEGRICTEGILVGEDEANSPRKGMEANVGEENEEGNDKESADTAAWKEVTWT